MESSANSISTLLNDKILLYQDLIEVLHQEKKTIRETDVDALWHFTQKKQTIAKKIEDLRGQILSVLDTLNVNHGMDLPSFKMEKVMASLPQEIKTRVKQQQITLSGLKFQVRELARGNKAFVEEYLNVLDEMITIIANAGNQDTGYNRSRASKGAVKANLLLHKEV
jgi:flagellar biosynthesis/type III secretory pathway chaperone